MHGPASSGSRTVGVDRGKDAGGLTIGKVSLTNICGVGLAAPISIFNKTALTKHRCVHLWGRGEKETKMRLEVV